MKRHEFVQLAIDNPRKAAKLLRSQARKLEKTKKTTDTAAILSETLYITDRTVYSDCKK